MGSILKPIAYYLLPSWGLVLYSVNNCSPLMPQVAIFSVAAMVTTTWLFHGLWQILTPPPRTEAKPSPIKARILMALLVVTAIACLVFAYQTGAQHDYIQYSKQWATILSGADPWAGTTNAYGPVHNLLAWPYNLHRLLPKALFALLLVATGSISAFTPLGDNDRTSQLQRCCLFAVFTLSPFCLITVNLYANNDILPAAAMVLALIGAVAFRSFLSRFLAGGLLALGAMSKFYPLIIAPSLLFRRRRIDWAFTSGFLGFLVFIASLAYRLWGTSNLTPLLFASSRESKHLSLFNFTRSVLNLNLDQYSTLAMLLVFIAVTWFLFKQKIDAIPGAIIVFAAVLSLYKMGSQQFFLFFFLVAPFAIRYLLATSNILTPKLMATFFIWMGFLNWYQLDYQLTCQMWEWPAKAFRQGGALPYLLISTLLAVALAQRMLSKDLRSADPPEATV